MIEHTKEIRRVYMVSSAVFSAASCVYGWAAPLGAALGLAVNLTEDEKKSNKEEFEKAIDCALDRTYKSITSDTKRKILEELCQIEVEPDNLNDLIKKTETYQIQYCTDADIKEILSIFEIFFRDEISKRPYLSNLYVLSTGFVTLEKLKQINDIIVNGEKKLDKIEEEVSSITKIVKDAEKICVGCLNSTAFIIISMAIFLGIGIFSNHLYDRMLVMIVPMCYAISDFLIFFLRKRQDIFKPIFGKFKIVDEILYKIIEKFIIPIILTVSCFWITIFAIDMIDYNFLFLTRALIIGKFVSLMIKYIMFRD
ncbi:MAG: hypothetical protein HDR30_05460 [Lachnospiraceae bacterium]|nr:hypothetical protein [Lachnospiraceae bacterium]